MDMTAARIQRARDVLLLVTSDPRRALELSTSLAVEAHAAGDVAAEAVAERTKGLAEFHLEDADNAVRHLRRAISLASRAGADQVAAEARMTLAGVLNGRGQPRVALKQIGIAVSELRGVERARAQAQRGAILHHLGQLDAASADYQTALGVLRRAGDGLWVQRVLSNRGYLKLNKREFAGALGDFEEAADLCRDLGLDLSLAFVQQNIGSAHSLRGAVPDALAYLDLAEDSLRRHGAQLGSVLLDRAEVLLQTRLLSEARHAAAEAVDAYQSMHRNILLPEARLLLGRIAFLQGDVLNASRQASAAGREFKAMQRPQWAALAQLALLTARLSDVSLPPTRGPRIEKLLKATEGRWPEVELDVRIAAGGRSLAGNRVARAHALLEPATRWRRHGPATLRARSWYAEALLRRSSGDSHGATRAARRGLRILDDFGAVIRATDMRAHLASHRVDLAVLGLRTALESGSARDAFAWSDLGRASALHQAPHRPVDDPVLADSLAELRLVTHDLDAARSVGHPTASLAQQQVILERRVRDHQRREARADASTMSRPSQAELSAALGDAAIVQYVALDGELHAITLAGGRTRIRHLGRLSAAIALAERLPFALHRLARRHVRGSVRDAAEQLLAWTSKRIDGLMIRTLPELVDRPLVVVPTGSLQWLPWSALPSCVGRPLTVSPSAAAWFTAMTRPHRSDRVAVVAGPGLPGARDEAVAVAEIHRVKPCLDDSATANAVSGLVRGASLIHLAAHGRVRADNPQFGSLAMADGPLMIYDMEELGEAPHSVVVAACDAGRPVIPVGDELLGLTASLLGQGSSQLVASVLPILDLETKPLMTDLHRELARGMNLASALADAQAASRATGPLGIATAAGFLCFGAGFTAPLAGRA